MRFTFHLVDCPVLFHSYVFIGVHVTTFTAAHAMHNGVKTVVWQVCVDVVYQYIRLPIHFGLANPFRFQHSTPRIGLPIPTLPGSILDEGAYELFGGCWSVSLGARSAEGG